MHNFMQLGVRNAEFPTPNRRRASDGGVFERIAEGVTAHHSCSAHDYKPLSANRSNVHLRLHGNATAFVDSVWWFEVMIMCAPPASRHRAGAPQTAMRHPFSQRRHSNEV